MKICYIGKHHSGGNDDEGAITHALTELGHQVELCHERHGPKAWRVPCDFVLFNHWQDYAAMDRITVPKVAWTFDLISFPSDPTLQVRCSQRQAWMRELIPRVSLCFMTDGDFVAQDKSGKLVWLPQGADGRIVGRGQRDEQAQIPILFTGTKRGGVLRESFVAEMQERYGSNFVHVSKGVYGEELKNLIASSKIVVAPDGPVSDRYWSNRVYVALGFGACLLHPWCDGLAKQYDDEYDLMFYGSRERLHELIENLLADPYQTGALSACGLMETKRKHLYQHRCEQLIQTVKERLF